MSEKLHQLKTELLVDIKKLASDIAQSESFVGLLSNEIKLKSIQEKFVVLKFLERRRLGLDIFDQPIPMPEEKLEIFSTSEERFDDEEPLQFDFELKDHSKQETQNLPQDSETANTADTDPSLPIVDQAADNDTEEKVITIEPTEIVQLDGESETEDAVKPTTSIQDSISEPVSEPVLEEPAVEEQPEQKEVKKSSSLNSEFQQWLENERKFIDGQQEYESQTETADISDTSSQESDANTGLQEDWPIEEEQFSSTKGFQPATAVEASQSQKAETEESKLEHTHQLDSDYSTSEIAGEFTQDNTSDAHSEITSEPTRTEEESAYIASESENKMSPQWFEYEMQGQAGKNVSDIKIDFNDRMAFLNQLFDGNQSLYDQAVNLINDRKDFTAAQLLVLQMAKELNWGGEQTEYVERLSDLVAKRFD
ncbi:MAG: hypothetical protein Q4F57_10060 [Weeksellaceae bacterium]|nr:hypothetical protein [Weeksellaceae bacterium]